MHLRLDLQRNSPKSDETMARFITEFPFWLEGFTHLSTVTVEVPILPTSTISGPRHRRVMDAICAQIFAKVGVQGQYVETVKPPHSHKWSVEFWQWKAGVGQNMDWSQNLGRIWKQPRIRSTSSIESGELPWNRLNLLGSQYLILRGDRFSLVGRRSPSLEEFS